MLEPSVGRIVHYTNLGDRDGKYPPEVQAALITGLNADGTVSLRVFYRTGDFSMPSVQHTDAVAGSEDARGKWAWPVLDPPGRSRRPTEPMTDVEVELATLLDSFGRQPDRMVAVFDAVILDLKHEEPEKVAVVIDVIERGVVKLLRHLGASTECLELVRRKLDGKLR